MMEDTHSNNIISELRIMQVQKNYQTRKLHHNLVEEDLPAASTAHPWIKKCQFLTFSNLHIHIISIFELCFQAPTLDKNIQALLASA